MRTHRLKVPIILSGGLLFAMSLALPEVGHSQQPPDLFTRIASALEAYAVDNNGAYPPDGVPYGGGYRYWATLSTALTTPVAYLAPADLIDPFGDFQNDYRLRYINFDYSFKDSSNISYSRDYAAYKALHGSWLIWSGSAQGRNADTGLAFDLIPYDPTNGVASRGCPFRSQVIRTETGVTTSSQ